MDKRMAKIIFMALILTVMVFVSIKYVITLREKYDLIEELSRMKAENQALTVDLAQEKGTRIKLSQQNLDLKGYLKASKNRMGKLFSEVTQSQNENEELKSHFGLLKAENKVLIEQRERIVAENESYKIKLSSAKELKKAIRDLKKQARKVTVQIKRKIEAQETIEGNRGYIVKEGELTYPSRVKIEVIPASTKE